MNLLFEGRNLHHNDIGKITVCGFHVELTIEAKDAVDAKEKVMPFIRTGLKRFPDIAETQETEIIALDWLMDDDKFDNEKLSFTWFRQKKWYEFWRSRYSEYKDSFYPRENKGR